MPKIEIDWEKVSRVERMMYTLLKTRNKKVLMFLESEGRTNVTEIMIKNRMPQSEVSAALGMLRRWNLVQWERIGQKRYYWLNTDRFRSLTEALTHFNTEDSKPVYG